MDADFSKYDLVIAPFLYMLKEGTIDRIEGYVKNGGNFVGTYLTGMVDEDDMCYLGGFPAGKLKDVFGVWQEETDSLPEGIKNAVSYNGKEYTVEHICDIIHAQGAEILGEYGKDFYKNMPAVTKNAYGEGKAFYVAFRNDEDFARDFCNDLINELSLPLDADLTLDDGLVMRKRGDVIFVMNFTDDEKTVTLDKEYKDLIKGEAVSGSVTIAPCSYLVIE
jgi:beta-galactosidase